MTAWQRCMRAAGQDFADPAAEVRLAVAEATCATDTGLGRFAGRLDAEHRRAVERQRRTEVALLPRLSADRGHVEVMLAAAVLGEQLTPDRTPGDTLLPAAEPAAPLEGAQLTAAEVRRLSRRLPVAASAVPLGRGEVRVKVAGAGAVLVDVGEPVTQLRISLLHSLGSVNVGTGHVMTAFRPPAHRARV